MYFDIFGYLKAGFISKNKSNLMIRIFCSDISQKKFENDFFLSHQIKKNWQILMKTQVKQKSIKTSHEDA